MFHGLRTRHEPTSLFKKKKKKCSGKPVITPCSAVAKSARAQRASSVHAPNGKFVGSRREGTEVDTSK